jgi:hypothetical protein
MAAKAGFSLFVALHATRIDYAFVDEPHYYYRKMSYQLT